MWYAVAESLEKFEGLDHKEIAKLLIEKGYWFAILKYLGNFKGFDSEAAKLLIEAGFSFIVAENLEKFEGLDHQKIAKFIIEKGTPVSIVENLEKFEGLDHQKIAELIIKNATEEQTLLRVMLERNRQIWGTWL